MSTSRLSLLVCLCLVGIALMLHWYLAAESRALAATRAPLEQPQAELVEEEATPDVAEPKIEIPAPATARPASRTSSSPNPGPAPVRSAATPGLPTPLGAR